jgi:iron complex outermembrane receptor protein
MNAHVDLDLGFGTLSIIPAYRHADLNYYAINSFSLNVIEKDDQYSLETRLTSKDSGKLRWIVGAFALGDHVSDIGNFDNFNGTGNRQNFKADTNSKAVFGDATYSLTDRIRLIGGIRYTDDHKTAFGLQTNLARTGGFIPLDGDAHFKRTNYRAGAQLDIAPRVMAYATVATGFHSGGFYFSNIVQPTDRNSYAPESILAYTVGLKSKLFDNKVLLDVELFRWQLKNQQVSLFTLDGTGQIIFPTLNAGRSTNQGVQVDGQYQATRTTMVGAQVQYLSAIFNQLSYTQAIPTQPGIACAVTGVAPAVHVNCSGLRSVQAPKWSVNLSGDQTVPLASGADFVFGARAHYQSRTLVGFNYLPDDYQKKVWTEDLTLTYNPDRKHWSIGAFVNNLSDQTIKSNATHNGNVEAYQLRPPRTYGGRFSVNF